MKQSKYLIETRRNGILKLLKEKTTVQVKELSEIFQVSELTIRRDLDALAEQKAITRFFGGAKAVEENLSMQRFEEKKISHREEKELIGRYTANLIEKDSTIFMNSGTTVLEVAKNLADKNVVIVTNNAIASTILSDTNCELLCTGGIYNNVTKAYVGEYSTKLIRETFAKVAIMGVNGISAEFGITTSVFQETALFEMMLEKCRGKKIVVTDGSKIGKIKSYKSADVNKIDMLITTSTADEEEVEKIKNLGVEVVIVDVK